MQCESICWHACCSINQGGTEVAVNWLRIQNFVSNLDVDVICKSDVVYACYNHGFCFSLIWFKFVDLHVQADIRQAPFNEIFLVITLVFYYSEQPPQVEQIWVIFWSNRAKCGKSMKVGMEIVLDKMNILRMWEPSQKPSLVALAAIFT